MVDMDPEADNSSASATPMSGSSLNQQKRRRAVPEEFDCSVFSVNEPSSSLKKLDKTPRKALHPFDPFALPNILYRIEESKYGSVAEDIKALCAQRRNMVNPNIIESMHSIEGKSRSAEQKHSMSLLVDQTSQKSSNQPAISAPIQNTIDDNATAESPTIIIDSDDELPKEADGDSGDRRDGVTSQIPEEQNAKKNDRVNAGADDELIILEDYNHHLMSPHVGQTSQKSSNRPAIFAPILNRIDDRFGNNATVGSPIIIIDSDDELPKEADGSSVEIIDDVTSQIPKEQEVANNDVVTAAGTCEDDGNSVDACRNGVEDMIKGSPQTGAADVCPDEKSNGVDDRLADNYEDDTIQRHPDSEDDALESYSVDIGESPRNDIGDDGLMDIWQQMAFAIESSKETVENLMVKEQAEEGKEDCDHSFILKDDIGDVCRICGLIQRRIETIIEFVYNKPKRSTRTYIYEPQNTSNKDSADTSRHGLPSLQNILTTKISVHPRHHKHMRPHQIEGFNFLCHNLITDDPGGCIMAHAPGSGKTFMVISFMQSFMAKYHHARPLVVLPKGIIETWKREFRRWQVEDIPLLDFHSFKAESRSQQLEVLRKWVKERSILLLGYKQFSAIICDHRNNKVSAECQDVLLKVPTILVLDEGHTSRNEETDVLQSLARVQTPRKVVLSGTLYQNHVKEVFNILNLVRPKFLKLPDSRAIVSRIMSRVEMPVVRKHVRVGNDLAFFDGVEHTLQNCENFTTKVAVIRDLRELTREVLHYYRGDFLDELPGLFEFTVFLDLSAPQKDKLKTLKKLDNRFKQISVGSVLYIHPGLKWLSENNSANGDRGSFVDEDKIDELLGKIDVRDGAKMKFFLNILGLCESTGEKLLVFSQYVLPLTILERLLARVKGWSPGKEIFTITGDTNPDQREWSMEWFNNSPDAKIFFGSIKACGEGISLVGASRVIILDVHLNPSVTRQAIARAFRPGQKREVYVYRLVAADSLEEEDYRTCSRKELISKMWFEWNESQGVEEFGPKSVEVDECGDPFLESSRIREDIKVLYKR